MQCLKLKTVHPLGIDYFTNNYSHAFRKVYTCFENIRKEEIQDKYNLDSWQYQSVLYAVKAKISQTDTNYKKKQSKLLEIEQILKSETDPKKRYKLSKKLRRLKKGLDSGITFGSKKILRELTKYKNLGNEEHYEKLLVKYRKNRIPPLYLIGEAPYKGNRKFNFDLTNKSLTFKPDRKTKIPIEFFCGKNQYKTLCKLQALADKKEIAISVRLEKDYVHILYDEEKLAGFHFNKNAAKKEIKGVKDTVQRKEIFKKHCIKQEEKQLANKISTRFMGVDLNPTAIGWSILDGEKLIDKGEIDLSELSIKLALSSSDPKQLYQNNKRRFEICNVWKYLFKIAIHYKIGYFCVENLEFNKETFKGKEFNRKTKNIWHRELTTQLIKKHSSINGIILREVAPAYSSFIGNIQHKFSDPINASLEICRRGRDKFKKSGFYPDVSRIDFDTMEGLLRKQTRDAQNKTIEKFRECSTWKACFDFFKQTGLKYRRDKESVDSISFSLNSHKSKISLRRLFTDD